MKKYILVVLLLTLNYSVQGEEISSPYLNYLKEICIEEDMPYEIMLAIGIVESNFKMINSSVNRDKSFDIGIFQLNSRYLSYFVEKYWDNEVKFNPYNPQHNIRIAVRHMRTLHLQLKSWELCIRAYNVGARAVWASIYSGQSYLNKVTRVLTHLDI